MLIIYNPASTDIPQVTDQTAINLNSIVKQGEYSGANITVSNGPANDGNTEFKLIVKVDPSTGYITQTFVDAAGVNERVYTTSWGAWFVTQNPSTGYTVAGLPSAAANEGRRTYVTDATANTFASTVAGGGANVVPVFSDGTSWIIG